MKACECEYVSWGGVKDLSGLLKGGFSDEFSKAAMNSSSSYQEVEARE